MLIRIKKKLYFKPRLCPDCGKPCFFCKCHLSQRCKRCHKKRHNRHSHIKRRISRKRSLTKYTHKYQRMRKRLIKEHPYCALCGSEIRLTVHHVGGGCEHFTVLCDRCHQEYERLNNKRKAKKCTRKNGIKRIIKNAKEVYLGIRLVAVRRHIRSKSLEKNLIC